MTNGVYIKLPILGLVRRFPVGLASLGILIGMTVGCEARSPVAPPTTAPPTMTVAAISPESGPTSGATPVVITGTGFLQGARVTLGRASASVTSSTPTTITAITRVHVPGAVDVVVTNPGNQSVALANGYIYTAVVGAPPPTIAGLADTVGSTRGGYSVPIDGTGFQVGAVVKFGDITSRPNLLDTTRLIAPVPAHDAGTVDVVVINPDEQSASLPRAFTYVLPQSLDFNGTWKGFADGPPETRIELVFTVRDNLLVSLSCGSATLPVAAPAPIANGEFSLSGEDGTSVSGRILVPSQACGEIHLATCNPTWCATKQ